MDYKDIQASRSYYLPRNSKLKIASELWDIGWAFVISVL